jgi:hypothetical protein
MARNPHGLDATPVPGPAPRLTDCHLCRDRFGVSFHPEHVRKVLKPIFPR